jgi:hypothetical protein
LPDSQRPAVTRVQATNHIRRLLGGSQPHLLRCSDGNDYVVKFQNNPQGAKTLANDLLGTLLAKELGLPLPEVAIIDVNKDLILSSPEMTVEYPDQINSTKTEPCQAGLCFGSRHCPPLSRANDWSSKTETSIFSRAFLFNIGNLRDFLGILAFDKWTGNTDSRQVVFIPREGSLPARVVMIDFGYCFHACRWEFSDYSLQGVVRESVVYDSVNGIEDFSPWLERIENKMNAEVIKSCAAEIPPEWYQFQRNALEILTDRLNQRRPLVRQLLRSSCNGLAHSFKYWIPTCERTTQQGPFVPALNRRREELPTVIKIRENSGDRRSKLAKAAGG